MGQATEGGADAAATRGGAIVENVAPQPSARGLQHHRAVVGGSDASRQIGDRRSKDDYTKTGDSRNQVDSRCSPHCSVQLFAGNHPDDARGSDYGILTDFQEMFWEIFR